MVRTFWDEHTHKSATTPGHGHALHSCLAMLFLRSSQKICKSVNCYRTLLAGQWAQVNKAGKMQFNDRNGQGPHMMLPTDMVMMVCFQYFVKIERNINIVLFFSQIQHIMSMCDNSLLVKHS